MDSVTKQMELFPFLEYVEPMEAVVDAAYQVLPMGIEQVPCPATRAFCVDLVRQAIKAESAGYINYWVAFTVCNIYIASCGILANNPHNKNAVILKQRSKLIIDRYARKHKRDFA